GFEGRAIPTRFQIFRAKGINPGPNLIPGRGGARPYRRSKLKITTLGRAGCPQPASFNIQKPERPARRRRDTPPYLFAPHLTGEGGGLSCLYEVGSSPNLQLGLCGDLLAGLS
ncbi:MAG: hypothetical protein ACK56I_20060, partial [bacterium]